MKRRHLPARADQARQRGFTLVELMVAMVAAMFVAIAVFTLAKHASGFAMRQSRVADAQLQSVIGFERLKADISRAGFLSSPNVVRDPSVCGTPGGPGASWLGQLASVYIEPVPSDQLSTESSVNGINPNRIVLAGSYDSPDLFVARAITQDTAGTGSIVFLAQTGQGMANIGYTDADGEAALGRVFRAGRALRIQDDAGGVQFGTIVSVAGGANPSITLAATPALQFRAGSGLRCGIRGLGNDFVNVVNIIRYDIQDLSEVAQFGGMFQGARPSYDGTRRELVREELNVDGTAIDGTLELVAEYAVDLGFSLFVAPNSTSTLTRVAPLNLANFAGDPNVTGNTGGPQLIRAVHAWLSVRSQEADRSVGLTVTPGPAVAGTPSRLRIGLNTSSAALPPFARVRTLQSTIPLNNQMRATWL